MNHDLKVGDFVKVSRRFEIERAGTNAYRNYKDAIMRITCIGNMSSIVEVELIYSKYPINDQYNSWSSTFLEKTTLLNVSEQDKDAALNIFSL
jgi:hypothetical protein